MMGHVAGKLRLMLLAVAGKSSGIGKVVLLLIYRI